MGDSFKSRQFLSNLSISKRIILVIAIFAAVLSIITVVVFESSYYEVILDRKVLAVVKDKETIKEIVIDLEKSAAERKITDIKAPDNIEYKLILLSEKMTTSDELIRKEIEQRMGITVKAFCIVVDGKEVAVLKEKRAAEEILNRIKAPYMSGENNTEISFSEEVEIIEKIVEANKVNESEEAYKDITAENDSEWRYVVQKGDTISEIAEKFGVNMDSIRKLNPDLKIDKIQIGQELIFSVPRYVINIKETTTRTYEENIPYDIEYEDTQELYTGDKKIKIEGREGKKSVEAQIIKVNGFLDQTVVVYEKILQEPQTEMVLRGTKERPKTAASGIFQNPSRGSLTSRFGERWGREHAGIDIGVPVGTPNKAADGGKVIFAGWKGNYGKLVIIDHENGYTTYYGHNNTIKVKAGERVAQGQVIGTAGTTGRVTGPHLHFEVRKNGIPVNPLKYVEY